MCIFSVDQSSAPWQSCGASHVAVYGTLRAGGVNDMVRLRQGLTPVGKTWLKGTLYDLGWYPGLRLQGEHAVLAEVYPLDAALEQALDGIEGLWPRDLGEYTKQLVSLPVLQENGGMVSMNVLVYEAVSGTVQGCPVIAAEADPSQPIDWLQWFACQGRGAPEGKFTLRTAG